MIESASPEIDPQTAETVLNAVREEYLSQERRHQTLISKTQTLATVATLFFTVTVASGGLSLANGKLHWLSIAGYAFAVIGVSICILALRSKEFHRIKHGKALEDSELCGPAEVVKVRLAKSYDESISKNEENYNDLIRAVDRASSLLLTSVVLGGIATLGGNYKMSADEKSKPQTPIQVPISQPSRPNTESYGTETIKKSEETATRPLSPSKEPVKK